MSEFIGTFTAPGTGEVGVLGLELIRDHDTGLSKGVVRLEKRPYCEGVTRCVIDLPATSEREALRLTGVWNKRGEWDGEGCNVTVSAIHAQTIPATPTLDETTNPADVEWGEVRSAVAAKDWRRAWEVVGTDHTGEATPGEAYIFGGARRVSCVSAALVAWRGVELPMLSSGVRRPLPEVRKAGARVLGTNERWQRIKQIAAWESSAAAQYVEPKAARARAWLAERTISTPRTVDGPFGGRVATVIIDDPVESDPELYGAGRGVPGLFRNPWVDPAPAGDEILRDLHAMQDRIAASGQQPRPTTIWMDEEMYDRLRAARPDNYTLTINGERQTYTVPASSMPDIAGALRDYIGQPLTAATRAAVEATVRRVTQDSARVANGNAAIRPNPAPHGPTRRRRR